MNDVTQRTIEALCNHVNCEHDWKLTDIKSSGHIENCKRFISKCAKCGARKTEFRGVQDNDE